jgi:hypothetical protein
MIPAWQDEAERTAGHRRASRQAEKDRLEAAAIRVEQAAFDKWARLYVTTEDRESMWIAWQARAHLSQPAHAVDVGADLAERVLSEYVAAQASHHDDAPANTRIEAMRLALTRALAGEKAEGSRA